MTKMRGGIAVVALSVACASPTGSDAAVAIDAGHDAAVMIDAGHDAGIDGGADAGADAGSDAGSDAGNDDGVDAGADTNVFWALTVTRDGNGTGTVTSMPAGIDCGATCTASLGDGFITLRATPDASSVFTGWSGGGCTGHSLTCSLPLHAATTVNATFELMSSQVSITLSGNGLVTSMPAGIDCGTTCMANFPNGSMVTLTQTGLDGWTFENWAGPCTGNGATCTFTVSGPVTVNAVFGP